MDDEKNLTDGNNDSEIINKIADELEREEAIDQDYDGNFSYGPNQPYSDQNVIDKLRDIRNNAQNHLNYGRRKKDEDIDERNGRKKKKNKNELEKKDNDIDDRNGLKDKKDKAKKDSSAGDTAKNTAKEDAKEAAKDTAKNTAKEGAKETAKEAGKEVAKEAAKEGAKEAGKSVFAKGIIFVALKYIAIGLLILYAIYLIIMLPIILYESFVSSISSFFGISEMSTEKEIDLKEYEQDGLMTDYKYRYVKESCDLDKYNESKCACSPDESGCTNLSHEDLIKVLKSEDKCKIDSSWLQFWDKIGRGFTGGKFNDECQLLRFVRGSIQAHEDFYKDYNLKLDKGLIVSSIIYSYDKQEKDLYSSDSANSNAVVDATNHYEVLKDIAKEGNIKSSDIDKLIKNTILEDIYPYYVYDGSSCVLQSKVNYKFSLDKWKIFMRFGGVGENSYLGISDNDFSAAGYLSINGDKILEKDITDYIVDKNKNLEKSPESLSSLNGTGWVYENALNNAWSQSAEECRGESFFTDRNITSKKDLSPYLQAVEDITSTAPVSLKSIYASYRNGWGTNKNDTIKFDYRSGFIYNKFTMYKKAIDEGNQKYDSGITPRSIEQNIQEIISRKADINEILFYENDESDIVDDINIEIVESKNYYWPIGSNETSESDGVTVAVGDPAYIKINSYFGMRKHPIDNVYKMHKGIDIAGKEGETNVIAAKSGKVVEIKNGCTPGNTSCGYGYGNYIKLQHPDGKYTFYAHLHNNSIKVSVNDEVKQGQVIAKVGNTGNSTGSHLHFEVRTSSTNAGVVNPLSYVDPANPRPASGADIALTSGDNNKSTVCLSLLNSGISAKATVALMINIQSESSFNPEADSVEADGDHSYGLFQWKGAEQKEELKQFANSKGLDYRSVEAQLNFVFYKMLHGGNRAKQAYESLMNEDNSAQTMATDFCILYERPKDKEINCPKRATKHYDQISKFVINGCKD